MRVGDKASIRKVISRSDIQQCARITGDRNPLHLDDEYAKKTRFGRRIAHGILSLGLISAVLGTKLPGPGTVYLSLHVKFLAPVYPGDTITATAQVQAIRKDKPIVTLSTKCHNQHRRIVISGKAVVLVDRSK